VERLLNGGEGGGKGCPREEAGRCALGTIVGRVDAKWAPPRL